MHLNKIDGFNWVQIDETETIAKACVQDESFWLGEVFKDVYGSYYGKIENNLFNNTLSYGQWVSFTPES